MLRNLFLWNMPLTTTKIFPPQFSSWNQVETISLCRAKATYAILEILKSVWNIYSENAACVEVFSQVRILLQNLKKSNLPEVLMTHATTLFDQVNAGSEKSVRTRKPLFRMEKQHTSLRTFEPKFHEKYFHLEFNLLTFLSFNPTKNYDPNETMVARKKLQQKLKQEKRNAIRNIKQDNYFIQSEKAKVSAIEKADREAKAKRVSTIMQQDQAESNAINRQNAARGRKKNKEKRGKKLSAF